MRTVFGAVQHYDWGDTSALPRLLHREPNGQPWAEIWFGTHHVAPSHLDSPDGPPLATVTGEMNMLVKLLSCASPLSLQTHPNLEQARMGFDSEESAGIDRLAQNRMYRDASDKPEMMIALEPFEALCGFAPLDQSISLFNEMGWHTEAAVLKERGIAGYLSWAFSQNDTPPTTNAPDWLQRVALRYPNDKGIRVAPLLHHVVLQPGEAIALPAGNLHAYLRGTGLEVMKSSDNVVRAGFTSKHIDVAELLRIVDTTVLLQPIVQTQSHGAWTHYPSPTTAFSVESIDSALSTDVVASQSHRMIFGAFDAAPSVKLLVKGESATLPHNRGVFWVCTQNNE